MKTRWFGFLRQGILIVARSVNDMPFYTAETDSKARGKMAETHYRESENLNLRLVLLDIARLAPRWTRGRPQILRQTIISFEEELKKAKICG